MKVIKIELNPEHNYRVETEKTKKTLFNVIVEVKKWYKPKTETIKAFPTTYGPVNGDGDIMYFIYIDDKGAELDYGLSEQITNWCQIKNRQIEYEKTK